MGRRSWIFFVYSKDTAKKVKFFCEKNDCIIFIVHYVIINGAIETKARVGIVHGNKLDQTPAILTQSDGNSIMREMVNQGIINHSDIIYLDNVALKELEDTGDGYKLKKAVYLSEQEFFEHLENESFPRRKIEFLP